MLIFCIVLSWVSLLFTASLNNNLVILNSLKDSDNWILIDNRPDSILVFEKNIEKQNLNALKVQKVINSSSNNIIDIIMNVTEYPKIMSDSEMLSFQIGKKGDFLYAYNNFPSKLPFISDRHYVFKLNKISASKVEWTLVSSDEIASSFKMQKIIDENPNAIYIEEGAGFWEVKPLSDNFSQVSYALYMDSGGNISDYLNDYFNSYSIVDLFKSVLKKTKELD